MQTGHERLAAWVERSKLKGYEVASLFGIHFTHLSKILSGKRPGLETVLKIEEHTGIPASSWAASVYAKSDRRKASAARKTKLAKEISHAAGS